MVASCLLFLKQLQKEFMLSCHNLQRTPAGLMTSDLVADNET